MEELKISYPDILYLKSQSSSTMHENLKKLRAESVFGESNLLNTITLEVAYEAIKKEWMDEKGKYANSSFIDPIIKRITELYHEKRLTLPTPSIEKKIESLDASFQKIIDEFVKKVIETINQEYKAEQEGDYNPEKRLKLALEDPELNELINSLGFSISEMTLTNRQNQLFIAIQYAIERFFKDLVSIDFVKKLMLDTLKDKSMDKYFSGLDSEWKPHLLSQFEKIIEILSTGTSHDKDIIWNFIKFSIDNISSGKLPMTRTLRVNLASENIKQKLINSGLYYFEVQPELEKLKAIKIDILGRFSSIPVATNEHVSYLELHNGVGHILENIYPENEFNFTSIPDFGLLCALHKLKNNLTDFFRNTIRGNNKTWNSVANMRLETLLCDIPLDELRMIPLDKLLALKTREDLNKIQKEDTTS